MIAYIIDTIGALWVLASLAFRSKFNFSSPYWNWRMNTAFPQGKVPQNTESKRRLAFEYARWAFRIRRLR
jgi:hypothetical protein